VFADAQFGRRWALYRFRGFRSGGILSRVIPAFRRNLNSVQNSAGIVLSIWQVPLPNLIPPEFRELPGFRQIPPESVEDSKDLTFLTTPHTPYFVQNSSRYTFISIQQPTHLRIPYPSASYPSPRPPPHLRRTLREAPS
jgi:hypothetical protein